MIARAGISIVLLTCLVTLSSAQTRVGGYTLPDHPPGTTNPQLGCDPLANCPSPQPFPGGLATDGSYVWVGQFFADPSLLHKVDRVTCAVVRTIPAPGLHIGGLAFDGANLWVLPEQLGAIFKVNPADGAVLSWIPAPSSGELDPNPAGIAWDGQFLWHADYGHAMIYKLDPANGNILKSFPAPAPCPSGIGYYGGILLVADFCTLMVYEISPVDGSVISSCPSPDTHPWDLEVPDGSTWLAGSDTNRLYHVDTGIVPTAVRKMTWGSLKLVYR